MNTKGLTLIEIIVVIGIVALLAAISIPNMLRAKMISNDAIVKSTLKAFATAAESFANLNQGSYPINITSLTGGIPAYLNTGDDYCGGAPISGFQYSCTMSTGGYTFVATPLTVGATGTTTFTITTGGIFYTIIPVFCSSKVNFSKSPYF